MNYQWYPGHMTKARRMMQEDIKLIDLIIELVDARIPLSSRNPDIDDLGKNKARLILLNKSDLADDRYNEEWKDYFQSRGFLVLKVNSQRGTGLKAVNGAVLEACRKRSRGIEEEVSRTGRYGHGGGYTQCGKIHIHQFLCGESLYENR